jgi:membrane protease YdiL (CAAX protease family)
MKYVRTFFEVLLYLFTFLAIQFVVSFIVTIVSWLDVDNLARIFHQIMEGKLLPDTTGTLISSVVSSILTLAVFLWLKWSPFSRTYLQSRPWGVLVWVVVLALGTIVPSTWLGEQIPYEMPQEIEQMLSEMLHNRWGYLAIGILAPIVEEMVFRGAILRTLLLLGGRGNDQSSMLNAQSSKFKAFAAILISALLFGAVHGNVQQFVHATLIGLILGWMYYRTNSIVPGIVFHWINNTAAYVIANVIPNSEHARLVDVLGGEQRSVWLALGFSLCLFLPALFQLWQRMKKVGE